MFKKLKALLIVIGLGALCAGISACATVPKTDEYRDKGYKISVTYNANGGKIMSSSGVSVVDMFNPDDYTAAGDGKIHIKLREPTDESRPTASSSKITVTNSGYFLAGWYRQRDLKTNSEGNPVDENGVVLFGRDDYFYYFPAKNDAGNYVDEKGFELVDKNGNFISEESFKNLDEQDRYFYYSPESGVELEEDEDKKEYELTTATAVFTYGNRWNFATDELTYSAGDEGLNDKGELNMTLYAAWVPDYRYEYYARNAAGEWELFSYSTFTGAAVEEVNTNADIKTIWTPQWNKAAENDDGRINHSHQYSIGSSSAIYTFPTVTGKTFKKAYSDPDCLNEIGSSFVHQGTLNLQNAQAVNRIQKIYVETYDELRFKISTPEQLAGCADYELGENAAIGVDGLKGYYEIMNDLSFRETGWPSAFTTDAFGGKIFSSDGGEIKFSDISVTYNSDIADYGGTFGRLTDTAELKDITFENIIFDLSYIGYRRANCYYGFFAGLADEEAKLTNVKITGNAEFRIGTIDVSGEDLNFNILSGGDGAKINCENKVKLSVYGTDTFVDDEGGRRLYRYTVDFTLDGGNEPVKPKIEVDGNGNITMTPTTQIECPAPSYDIDYQEA